MNHEFEILKKLIDYLNTGGLNSHFMRAEMCRAISPEHGIAPEKTIFVRRSAAEQKPLTQGT
ncbi:hypothetical protein KCP75_01445 [Salmonella enterica subsp. enterica]|nr:hypothetical protein KCP75_01445 [Salmonella enterica subsp. enterica]